MTHSYLLVTPLSLCDQVFFLNFAFLLGKLGKQPHQKIAVRYLRAGFYWFS